NTAFEFDGTSTRVQLPSFNLKTNQMTIVAWINPNGSQKDQTGILVSRNGDDLGGFFINRSGSDALSYVWAGTGSWDQFKSGLVPVAGVWNFVALVIDPKKGTVYLDPGDGTGLQTASFFPPEGHKTVVWSSPNIGVDNGYDRWFNGSIDEVAVYDWALSPAEIANLDLLSSAGRVAPRITQQPASRTVYAGQSVVFDVVALGALPLTYQWQHNNTNLPGATSTTLVLTNLSSANAGSYMLMVTNPLGNASSSPATLTVITPTPGSFAATVMASQPLAYWRFNESSGETAFDSAGLYDGTIVGGLTEGSPEPRPPGFPGFEASNSSFVFNDTDAYVQPPTGLDVNPNAFSIACWIKVAAFDKSWQAIVTKGDSSWRVHRGGGSDHIGFGTSGLSNQDLEGSKNVNDGQWHFVVALYDGSTKAIYVDGALDVAVSVTGTLAQNAYPVLIGENAQATGRFFNGNIDEVVLYNKALSAETITGMYAASKYGGGTAPFVTGNPQSQAVLVGSTVALTGGMGGTVPLSYQWKKDGVNVPGATGATLSLTNVYFTDAGSYVLWATNGAGHTNTSPAMLTVDAIHTFANLTNGMVLHLKFDGNYTDSSGHNNNGTAVGTPGPNFVAGKIGTGALRYDTVLSSGAITEANYVSLGTPTDLAIGPSQNFSTAFWIKFTGTPGDLPFFGNTINSYGDPGIDFAPSWEEGSWSWYISDQAASAWQGLGLYSPAKTNLNDGKWHSLVHTFDRTSAAVTYLDGVKVDATPISSGATWNLTTPNDWEIGQAGGGAYAVAGDFQIDDLGFWRRALSQSEAQSIYIVGQNYGRTFDVYGPVKVSVTSVGTNIDVSWQAGTLLQSTNVTSGYTAVPGATAPFYRTSATSSATFFRVQQ
ncbi:MAG: LamG domain-containing protein, partial [Verrucomicrobia bacterium]|nr:LamG domain-containing protein [Verrucomicrobiota bacterium]